MDFNFYKNKIDNYLDLCLQIKKPAIIHEAMRYSVINQGKRIRPILSLAAADVLKVDIDKVLPFACAIEFIHCCSLIHDDLPAMDNDDYRRGKLTNHKQYGEAIAILAGDSLLNLPYEIMSKACLLNPTQNNLFVMNYIADATGVNGMIKGQVIDIISEGKKISKELLLELHENKTGALIRASLVAGAAMATLDNDMIKFFEKLGLKLGLIFQIKDDILDVTSTKEKIGKDINSDLKSDKSTYVTLFGLEKAKYDYDMFSKQVLDDLKTNFGIDNNLYSLFNYIINRDN